MDLGAMPTIRCRAARIHQVVVNLLTNAIDACAEEDGVVTVHTETEPEVMGVRIDIEDNGCGIDATIKERIFDPFFTTKPIGQGTGLGLSISYGIVQEHGGRIELASEPGHGARFTVHLPVEPRRTQTEDDVSLLSALNGGPGGEPHEEDSPPLPSLSASGTQPASQGARSGGLAS
jgi:signal transduction histidine kinase